MISMQSSVAQSKVTEPNMLRTNALSPSTLPPNVLSPSTLPPNVLSPSALSLNALSPSALPAHAPSPNPLPAYAMSSNPLLPNMSSPNAQFLGLPLPNTLSTNSLVCPIKFITVDTCSNCVMKVGGKGTAKTEPDRASVVLGVVTENLQLENAQQENTRKMSAVIDSLIKNGVPEENIKTQYYQIQPRYDYVNGEQVFRGYQVDHKVRVEISNTGMVGTITDDAVRAGANTVSDIIFHVSNPQVYYEMAVNQALGDAVSKAVSLGTKMNVYVNPVPLRITEITTPVTAPIPYISMQAAEAATPIQPGKNEITAILEVEFVYSCSRNC